MNRHLLSILVVFLAFVSITEGRTWTDKKGRTFEGLYTRQTEDTVTIIRDFDRQAFTIDKSILSAADRDYLRDIDEEGFTRKSRIETFSRLPDFDYSNRSWGAADIVGTAAGLLIAWWLGHAFALPSWSFLRMIALNFVTGLSFALGILLTAFPLTMIVNDSLGVLIVIPIAMWIALWAGAKFIGVSKCRLLYYYIVNFLCQLVIVVIFIAGLLIVEAVAPHW